MDARDLAGTEPASIEAVVTIEGKRVLEVGCGDGRLTAFLAGRAAAVYAFDPSEERIAAARDRLASSRSRASAATRSSTNSRPAPS